MIRRELGDPPFPAHQAVKCDMCGGDGGYYSENQFPDIDLTWYECRRCGGHGVISTHQWIQDGQIYP